MWNRILEDAIIGKLVSVMMDNGFRIEFCNQDGGGLFMYAAPDGKPIPKHNANHWVRLQPENAQDVIIDYTVNLEEVLKPVNDFIKRFAEE